MWRWVVGLMVVALAGCPSGDAPEDSEATGEAVPGEVPFISGEREPDPEAPNPEFTGSTQRGPWALRLWVGLWCDHAGHPAGGTAFRVFVDDVALYRLDGACTTPTAAPGSRPNAGAFAFTLGQGQHDVRLVAPDGQEFRHTVDVSGDTWLTMVYQRDGISGEAEVEFDVSRLQLYVDRSYEAATAPDEEAVRAYAAGELEQGEYRRPSAELLEGQGAPTEAAVRGGEAAESGESASRSGDRAGRARRGTASEQPGADGWRDAAMGVLAVRSQEPAVVWIDGESTGRTTPVAALPLRMGRYRVELRHPESGDVMRSFSVEIEPGSTRTLVN